MKEIGLRGLAFCNDKVFGMLGSCYAVTKHQAVSTSCIITPHTAQCAVCKVYFSAQPNNLKPILNFQKYYPIEHIFVPACSSARKEHFFKF